MASVSNGTRYEVDKKHKNGEVQNTFLIASVIIMKTIRCQLKSLNNLMFLDSSNYEDIEICHYPECVGCLQKIQQTKNKNSIKLCKKTVSKP